MQDHIVIMNTPKNNGIQYLIRLVKQFRENSAFKNTPIQLLTSEFPDGLPDKITSLGKIIHTHGRADSVDNIKATNVAHASHIIVLAKAENDNLSDGRTFDILHRLSDMNITVPILAECVDDNDRPRLKSAGADLIIRPIRAYPEMIVRAFVAPGSEEIIENMFSHSGDEYMRYDLTFTAKRWADIVCKLANNDLGTAIGYIDKETSTLQCNPPQLEPVNASALFIVSREEKIPSSQQISDLLMQCENSKEAVGAR